MEIKESSNPIGEVVENQYIDIFVESMKAVWDTVKKPYSWWKFWEKRSLVPVTDFLLKCLDDLIAYVDQFDGVPGSDKKATVLFAVGKIYDYIVKEAMPLWLKPFSYNVREYVINVLISHSIDWIIKKYRKGEFKPTPAEQLEAQWVSLHGKMFNSKF
jgi:hypothetical protein